MIYETCTFPPRNLVTLTVDRMNHIRSTETKFGLFFFSFSARNQTERSQSQFGLTLVSRQTGKRAKGEREIEKGSI